MTQEISLIRPNTLEEFIGQKDIKINLNIYATAAKIQNTPFPHMMLSGGPGLGKTSCAFLIAQLMEGNLKTINGVSLQKTTDITSVLATLKKGDFIFIDEIHRINKKIEEILYSAMEDFVLDLIIGEGSQSKIIKIKLPPFTVIGATTKFGLLSQPFRNRFGIHFRFENYSIEDLCIIIKNYSEKNKLICDSQAIHEIAIRSKKTPRIALNLTKRIVDFMYAKNETCLSGHLVLFAMKMMGIDKEGLENIDRIYLKLLKKNIAVGLNTLSAILQESNNTIEETIEPYLLTLGFIERTSKGRVITELGTQHIQNTSTII
jgi:holliday junction DNA helicase RuvB